MRRGLTLVEVLVAAALLAVLAASAAPLLGELAAAPRRLAALAASQRLAALGQAQIQAALAGSQLSGWVEEGLRLEVLPGGSADPELVEALDEGALRRHPTPASHWVECRVLAADGSILARCPRLLALPEADGDDADGVDTTDTTDTSDEVAP